MSTFNSRRRGRTCC